MAKAVTIEHEHDSMLGFGNDIGLWPELASMDLIFDILGRVGTYLVVAKL